METLCNIKAHTIRIWELRYGVPKPSRKNTAIRFYSVDELEKVLKLSLLNRNGFKISRLAIMSDGEVQSSVNRLSGANVLQEKAVNHLFVCMYRMNVEGFEATLDSCFLSWPVIEVMQHVIYPFLQKVGLLFQGKGLTEEHLVVTVIRKKLVYCTEKIDASPPNNKKVLLFLCGERQLDLFLLYAACLLKQQGYAVINLGTDVSFKNLRQVIALCQPKYLLTYCHKKQHTPGGPLLDLVKDEACVSKVIVVQPERQENSQQTATKLAEVYYEDLWQVFEEGQSSRVNHFAGLQS